VKSQFFLLCGSPHNRKDWIFLGSDRGGETAAVGFTILAGAKRHQIEPYAYVKALLDALSSPDVDLESLLPDVWIKAHPEHMQKARRAELDASADRRRRRRMMRRALGKPDPVEPVAKP
jgi:hypothetical protein